METQEGGGFQPKSSPFTSYNWRKQKNQNVSTQKKAFNNLQHELAQQHNEEDKHIRFFNLANFFSPVLFQGLLLSPPGGEGRVIQGIKQIIGLIRENVYSNETRCDGAITTWNVILLCVDQAESRATRMDCTFFRGSLSSLNDAIHLHNNRPNDFKKRLV